MQPCKRNRITRRNGQRHPRINPHKRLRNGKEWTSPSGWSVYTSKGQTRADLLADDLARVTMKDLGSKAVCGVWQNSDIDYLDR